MRALGWAASSGPEGSFPLRFAELAYNLAVHLRPKGVGGSYSHPLAGMGPQDASVELRPNVAKEIRDRLVGKIFQVKLKLESLQDGTRSPRGLFKRFTSRVGVSKPPRGHPPKEYKQDATVLLTVESLEVYSGSNEDNGREHVEPSQESDASAPPLHSPPSSLEGHVYSYSISMSQVHADPSYEIIDSQRIFRLLQSAVAQKETIFSRSAGFASFSERWRCHSLLSPKCGGCRALS